MGKPGSRDRSVAVLELRKALQRVFGGASKYHLLVLHLEGAEGHHDVFRAHAQEPPDRQHREGDLLVGGDDQIIVPTVSLASLTTVMPTTLDVR
jgi:hypothetical protein